MWFWKKKLYLKRFCVDQDGCTALIMAAHMGHQDCLSILLANGAEVDKLTEVSAMILSPCYTGSWYCLFCFGAVVIIILVLIRVEAQLS